MIKEFQPDETLKDFLADLPDIAESASEEVRNLLKAALARLIQDMDLAYQEELDTLKQMLLRAEQRVQQLEEALDKIETD
jgi:BMFP domain-containing protein YqiC